MIRILTAAALAASMAACATLEPEPCTTEWVEWKTERTLQPFAREHRGLINDLRGFSQNLENPGPLTMVRMAARLNDFQALATDFQDEVMPVLQSAVDQCGAPAKFIPAFTGFLRKEGVEEEMLVWVETLGAMAVEQSES